MRKIVILLFLAMMFLKNVNASQINLYPEIVELNKNITIEINITGSQGDTWELLVVRPDGVNETLDTGTLGAGGGYIANYSYNSSLTGTYHVNILLNGSVNVSSSWQSYIVNGAQTQNTFVFVFSLNVSINYITNGTQRQSAFVEIYSLNYTVSYITNGTQRQSTFTESFSLNLTIPLVVNGTQRQSAFVTAVVYKFILELNLDKTYSKPSDYIEIYGKAKAILPNGTEVVCSDLPIDFYFEGTTKLLYNPSTGLIEETGSEQTYTDSSGAFSYLFRAPAQDGVYYIFANMSCSGYYGSNKTYFIVPTVMLRIYPEQSFSSWKNSSFWSYGVLKNALIGLVKDGISVSYTNSSAEYIELNYSHQDKGMIVFTRKDEKIFEKNVKRVENGEFFWLPRLTFGYGGAGKYTAMIILRYSDINILGDLILHPGVYSIKIINWPRVSGKAIKFSIQ